MMLQRYQLASIVIVELAIAGVLWTMTSSQVIHGLLILWAIVETGALCRHLYNQRQQALRDAQEGFALPGKACYLKDPDDFYLGGDEGTACDPVQASPSTHGHGMEH